MSMKSDQDVVAYLQIPGGVQEFWLSEDPGHRSEVSVASAGELLEVRWHHEFVGGREVFLVPNRPLEEVLPLMTVEKTDRAAKLQLRVIRKGEPAPSKTTLLNYRDGVRSLAINVAVGVKPVEGTGLSARDEEVEEALRALGYVFDDEK